MVIAEKLRDICIESEEGFVWYAGLTAAEFELKFRRFTALLHEILDDMEEFGCVHIKLLKE